MRIISRQMANEYMDRVEKKLDMLEEGKAVYMSNELFIDFQTYYAEGYEYRKTQAGFWVKLADETQDVTDYSKII